MIQQGSGSVSGKMKPEPDKNNFFWIVQTEVGLFMLQLWVGDAGRVLASPWLSVLTTQTCTCLESSVVKMEVRGSESTVSLGYVVSSKALKK